MGKTKLNIERSSNGYLYISVLFYNDQDICYREQILSHGLEVVSDSVMRHRFETMKTLMEKKEI